MKTALWTGDSSRCIRTYSVSCVARFSCCSFSCAPGMIRVRSRRLTVLHSTLECLIMRIVKGASEEVRSNFKLRRAVEQDKWEHAISVSHKAKLKPENTYVQSMRSVTRDLLMTPDARDVPNHVSISACGRHETHLQCQHPRTEHRALLA